MSSFAFILTDFDYKGDLPIELISDHYLNKPTSEQLQTVKSILSQVSSQYNNFFYEKGRKKIKKLDETDVKLSEIPKKEWRYWVINFDGDLFNIEPLKYILNVVFEREVTVGFVCNKSDTGNKFHPTYFRGQILSNYFQNHSLKLEGVLKITKRELESVSTYFEKLDRACKINKGLFGSLDNYELLKDLPYLSKFKTLGYFTIIESLITHQPKPSDPGDSLRRQLASKMNLLNNRFDQKLNIEKYFEEGVKFTTIWKKLYDLRSEIAHGSFNKFSSHLEVLNDRFAVDSFLNEATRAILKHSLNEPQLIVDLKAC